MEAKIAPTAVQNELQNQVRKLSEEKYAQRERKRSEKGAKREPKSTENEEEFCTEFWHAKKHLYKSFLGPAGGMRGAIEYGAPLAG